MIFSCIKAKESWYIHIVMASIISSCLWEPKLGDNVFMCYNLTWWLALRIAITKAMREGLISNFSNTLYIPIKIHLSQYVDDMSAAFPLKHELEDICLALE